MLATTKYALILLTTISLLSCNDSINVRPSQAALQNTEDYSLAHTYHNKDVLATETTLNAEGKKDGPYKEWYPNGKLQVEKVFKNDELLSHKLYTKDGKIIQNIVYKDGRKYGLLFSSFCMNGVAKSGEKDSLIFNAKN